MSSTATMSDGNTPVAPWWHTVLVLLILAATSVAGSRSHGLPKAHLPGLNARVSSYLTVLVVEWLIVFVIWLGLRARGLRIGDLVSARWRKATAFLRDLGLAIAFLVVATPCLWLVGWLLRARYNPAAILPTTAVELVLWLLLAATAGFCEELIFRGYFSRQFGAWSGRRIVGVVLQGVVFGLAHGYQGWRMMALITVFGWMFGALALWRRSLLPGMLAHWMQDSMGGISGFLAHR